eukprot:m.47599 g.47599  ORF g.47599 m.47599 type:complete len:67 (-) comp12335_c0_seq1:2057-2257(-)
MLYLHRHGSLESLIHVVYWQYISSCCCLTSGTDHLSFLSSSIPCVCLSMLHHGSRQWRLQSNTKDV